VTILVAIADDATRDGVIDVALRLGRAAGEELYVVHLVEDEVADADAKRIRRELRRRFVDEDIVSTISIEYIGHTGRRSGSRIGRELIDIASDVSISHIVMGHVSKPLVRNIRQGNTAFTVVNDASVPVTIVTEDAETEAAEGAAGADEG
jgi:nucleotide-binding universal stress UspA family protein